MCVTSITGSTGKERSNVGITAHFRGLKVPLDARSKWDNLMNMQAKAPPSPFPLRIGPLETASDVKREAARLYRAARRGEVVPGDASKLASVLALIARVIEGAEAEAQLTALAAEVKDAQAAVDQRLRSCSSPRADA
jgi:hypothetical protein